MKDNLIAEIKLECASKMDAKQLTKVVKTFYRSTIREKNIVMLKLRIKNVYTKLNGNENLLENIRKDTIGKIVAISSQIDDVTIKKYTFWFYWCIIDD